MQQHKWLDFFASIRCCESVSLLTPVVVKLTRDYIASSSYAQAVDDDLEKRGNARDPIFPMHINRLGEPASRGELQLLHAKTTCLGKFAVRSMASRMEQAEAKLREPVVERQTLKSSLLGHAKLSPTLDRLSLEPIRLTGSRDQQIHVVLKIQKANARYKDISLLRTNIRKFLREVDEVKQPISRIHVLVQDVRNYREIKIEITNILFVLQVCNQLLAIVLFFRCDYVILFNFVTYSDETT